MKVLAVVDVQSLFLAAREDGGPLARMDFVKLKESFTSDPEDTVDAVAYILASPVHDDKQFVRFLKKNGFMIMRKFAKLDYNDPKQKSRTSWSHQITWDTLKLYPAYDRIIIVSGNGNFVPVVEAITAAGKQAIVMSFASSLNSELARRASRVVYLTKFFLFDASERRSQNEQETQSNESVSP